MLDTFPVTSGSDSDRRILTNCWVKFYLKDYSTFGSKANLKRRSPSTELNGLKDLGIKRKRFDRYSCLVYFHGEGDRALDSQKMEMMKRS